MEPSDTSIFLPQLKRFKNYVLTNLKKARTSQARISNLDSHTIILSSLKMFDPSAAKYKLSTDGTGVQL